MPHGQVIAARQEGIDLVRPGGLDGLSRNTLPNGLQVVLKADSSLPLATTCLSFRVGSRDDPPGRTGLAHLFEHLFFQGSQHVAHGELLRAIQLGGGHANGSTWYDTTSFHATLPSHQLATALWLDSDRLGYFLPALDEERLETQRRVVLNERRKRFDNRPYGKAYEVLHELLFPPGHPYRHPVIGHPDDLETIGVGDARALFTGYYAPANAVLTVVGDFEPRRTLDLVADYFGELPSRAAPPRRQPVAVHAGERRRQVISDHVPLARVYLGCRLPPYPTAVWYAGDLACEALTRGRSSLLHRDLVVERQIAQDVTSFVLPTELDSAFVLVATCKPGVPATIVEEALLGHLDALGREPIHPKHHQRGRNRVVTEHFRGLQSGKREAESLARATLLLDDPEHVHREPTLYAGVGPDDLLDCFARHLRPDAAAALVYLPAEVR